MISPCSTHPRLTEEGRQQRLPADRARRPSGRARRRLPGARAGRATRSRSCTTAAPMARGWRARRASSCACAASRKRSTTSIGPTSRTTGRSRRVSQTAGHRGALRRRLRPRCRAHPARRPRARLRPAAGERRRARHGRVLDHRRAARATGAVFSSRDNPATAPEAAEVLAELPRARLEPAQRRPVVLRRGRGLGPGGRARGHGRAARRSATMLRRGRFATRPRTGRLRRQGRPHGGRVAVADLARRQLSADRRAVQRRTRSRAAVRVGARRAAADRDRPVLNLIRPRMSELADQHAAEPKHGDQQRGEKAVHPEGLAVDRLQQLGPGSAISVLMLPISLASS